jgi:hypothetical protein
VQRLDVHLGFQHVVDVTDGGEARLEGHGAHALGEHRAADGIDDEVHALAAGRRHHRSEEIGGARADADVEARLLQAVELLLAAGGADHARAERLGALHRGDTDARGDAGHEHPFAFLQPALQHEHVVHDQEDERDRGRLFEGEALGHRDRLARIHHRVLRERARATAHDALSDAEALGARTELGDLARAFHADRLGGAGLLQAMPEDELAAIERGRAHLHQHLPRPGLGHGDLTQLDMRRVGGGLHRIGFHRRAFRFAYCRTLRTPVPEGDHGRARAAREPTRAPGDRGAALHHLQSRAGHRPMHRRGGGRLSGAQRAPGRAAR